MSHAANEQEEVNHEPVNSVLSGLSYAALNQEGQGAVKAIFDLYTSDKEETDRSKLYAQFEQHSLQAFRKKNSLAESSAIYAKRLEEINPVSFKYLNQSQRAGLREELLFGFFTLSAQFYLYDIENRKQYLRETFHNILKTTEFIARLDLESATDKAAAQLEIAQTSHPEKLCKYLGIPLGQELGKEVLQFTDSKTAKIKTAMGVFNERRLYWVWGEDAVSQALSLLPDSFKGKNEAQARLHAPDKVAGAIGWILYYLRFSLELTLLLKHTLKGKWMSKQEALIPWTERFTSQWQQRKFLLLNDFAWATVNLITYFWLIGRSLLGYLGNVITVALLMFDAALTLWRFLEERTKHNALMLKYKNELNEIDSKLQLAASDEERNRLEAQRRLLQKSKEQTEMDWRYKKYHLSLDVAYSSSLVVTFAMACTFLVPAKILAPATAHIIGMTGSVLCFAITFAYVAVSGAVNIAQSKAEQKAKMKLCEDLLEQFERETDPDVKKLIYLDILQYQAQSEYQGRMANFQKMDLVRGLVIDAMIPVLVFVTLLYLPLAAGIGVLIAGLLVMAASKLILNQFEPKAPELPKFDKDAYEAFEKDPKLESTKTFSPEQGAKGFFDKKDIEYDPYDPGFEPEPSG